MTQPTPAQIEAADYEKAEAILAPYDWDYMQHQKLRSAIASAIAEERAAAQVGITPTQAKIERDNLYGYVNGLLGLLQLENMPPAIADVLNTNHRATDAAAYLTQITAAAEVDRGVQAGKALTGNLNEVTFGENSESVLHNQSAAALTVAAEVGGQDHQLCDEHLMTLQREIDEIESATIERCAQVIKKYVENLTDPKSDLMTHWDQIRQQCEDYKGSDMPRLNFEGMIEALAEHAAAAIRKLKDER